MPTPRNKLGSRRSHLVVLVVLVLLAIVALPIVLLEVALIESDTFDTIYVTRFYGKIGILEPLRWLRNHIVKPITGQ